MAKSTTILTCIKKSHVFISLSCICDGYSIKWHYLCTRKDKIVLKDNVKQRFKGNLLKRKEKTMITAMVLLVVGAMVAQAIHVNNKIEMGK
mgnify:CR=1 FL=1